MQETRAKINEVARIEVAREAKKLKKADMEAEAVETTATEKVKRAPRLPGEKAEAESRTKRLFQPERRKQASPASARRP